MNTSKFQPIELPSAMCWAFDLIGSRIAILDRHGFIQFANGAWCNYRDESDPLPNTDSWVGCDYLSVCQRKSSAGDVGSLYLLENFQPIMEDPAEGVLKYVGFSSSGTIQRFLRMTPFTFDSHRLLMIALIQLKHEDSHLLNQQRLALATEVGGIGIWDYDFVDNRLVWDERMYRLYGIPQESFEGVFSDWQNALHPDDREMATQIVLTSMEQRLPLDTRFRVVHPDGRVRHLLAKAKVIEGDATQSERMIGLNMDITAQVEQEFELALSEQRFRDLVNTTDGIVWESDLTENTYSFISEQAVHILGYPVEAWYEPNFSFEILHPDDYKRAASNLEICRSQPQSTFEYRCIAADGRIVWLRNSIKVVEENGEPRWLRGLAVDITAEKRAQQELEIAATAFDTQNGIIVTDENGYILRINQAFKESFGYTEEDVVGCYSTMVCSTDYPESFYDSIWSELLEQQYWEGEVWIQRKNAGSVPTRAQISSITDERGTITHYVGTYQDISDRKQAEERIFQLAYYDQLTSLPNRSLLLDRITQVVAAGERASCYSALCIIDLDNFKNINDSTGHQTGDELLIEVAHRLRAGVRGQDTVARLGGDEFVIMLLNLSGDRAEAAGQASHITAKLLMRLEEPYVLSTGNQRCTASLGITLFSGGGNSATELMKQADLAMYHAKSSGRNTLCFFDPIMQETIERRAELERELEQAIRDGQLRLMYQAQVTEDDVTIGAEALVRWQHPLKGLVPPGEFIAIAEESGLIIPLGDWVLNTACHQLSVWSSIPIFKELTVSINVSMRQFIQPDFVAKVKQALTFHHTPPERLKIEITESMLAQKMSEICDKVNELRTLGVSFSLDDFGTGYSSLSYLKQLPIDQLKIDRSFVRDIFDDPNDEAIARTIIALSEILNLNVLAEGVETEAQKEKLQQLGCGLYQGYLFGRPLPVKEFEEYLIGQLGSTSEFNHKTRFY